MGKLALTFYMIKGKLHAPTPVTTSFANKTVIVTGSNTGLGYEAALRYVELEARVVILAVRDLAKGQAAKERIELRTKRENVVRVWQLDQDNFESVDAFARRVDEELDSVHVAVLNAGVLTSRYQCSSEGWEKTLQVNTLSTALLAMLLLPKLEASASTSPSSVAHLEIVSSMGHRHAVLQPLADPSQRLHQASAEDTFDNVIAQYNRSKLFTVCITRELASRAVDQTGLPRVIISDACPGACRSDMPRDFRNPVFRMLLLIGGFLTARTAEQGARTIVRATTLGRESHGRFIVNDGVVGESPFLASKVGMEMQKAIWDEVVGILSERIPRVRLILADLTGSGSKDIFNVE